MKHELLLKIYLWEENKRENLGQFSKIYWWVGNHPVSVFPLFKKKNKL